MKKDPSGAVQAENRRLAAIMFTDIVGFSRQMGRNEARTLRLLEAHNQIVQHAVTAHQGNVIKTIGDAFLVDFPSVVNAVQCAQRIQAQFRAHNTEKESAEQIHVRVGIHLGDIVQKEGDVFGDGVNIASRLQALAEPDTMIFALQDEIRQKIVTALKVKLTPEEHERFQYAPTNNLEAYDYYLRGVESRWRAFYETKKELNAQARQLYEKALELDSHYAAVYAELGWTYFYDWFFQWNLDRVQSLERALEMGQRAVALNDSLSLPHLILGRVYLYKKQHDQAIVEAERAIAVDSNDADGYANLGNILSHAGRPEEGLGLIEKAMRLNPQYPPYYLNFLGSAYREAGHYEEALAPLKKFVTLNPNLWHAHAHLAACYAELGRWEEARAEVEEVRRLIPNFSLEWMRQNWPIKDPTDLERYLDSLRKAGFK